MKWLSCIFIAVVFLFKCAMTVLLLCWDALLLIVDIIDTRDDEDYHPNNPGPYYHYHTGEIDPVKYWDGIYDDKPW